MRLSFFISFIFISQFILSQNIIPGANRTDLYLSQIQDKKVGVVCNTSSTVMNETLVDFLISKKVNITTIFAPEHGFRANADAGAHVQSSIDSKTNIPIKSLYGDSKKPTTTDFKDIDIVVFDIQDVGCRFYTYISTLQYMLEACADAGVPIIVLDRPNPNGHYIDGPVLEKKLKSFVGMQPVPIVYGMTIGEYAKMLVGEQWLKTKANLKLTVIPCDSYTHKSKVELASPPSPNLKSAKAIELYPSLCLFEGTNVSVGRGTDRPFEMYGSPYIDFHTKGQYSFIPLSKTGASKPLFFNKECRGEDLNKIRYSKKSNEIIKEDAGAGLSIGGSPKLNLQYLFNAYSNWTISKDSFFLKNNFFDKLAGNTSLRAQIIAGKSEEEIRKSWEPALSNFKKIRKKYLLYSDF